MVENRRVRLRNGKSTSERGTPPEHFLPDWKKRLNGFSHLFPTFGPDMISNIEVFQRSRMAELVATKLLELDQFRTTEPDRISLLKHYQNTFNDVADTSVDCALNEKIQAHVTITPTRLHDAQEVATYPQDAQQRKLIERLRIAGINDKIQVAKAISAYRTNQEMANALFILLSGSHSVIETSPGVTVEKEFFSDYPKSFLSTIGFLIVSYEYALEQKKQRPNVPATKLSAYILKESTYPISAAITTMEYAETNPNYENPIEQSMHMSMFSQLMSYLCDRYYIQKLEAAGITLPLVVEPAIRQNILNRWIMPPDGEKHSEEGFMKVLEEAGFLETALNFSLYSKGGATKLDPLRRLMTVEDSHKSGFRTILNYHPKYPNYVRQLMDLNPEAAKVININRVPSQLLNAKLGLPVYAAKAQDPKFYLDAPDFFKFRFIVNDDAGRVAGFNDMVQSVIRDLSGYLGNGEAIRKSFMGFYVLSVNSTGTVEVNGFDRDDEEFQKFYDNPSATIYPQFQQGGRSMVFLRFKTNYHSTDFPIEIQIIPESYLKELHNQRTDFVEARFMGLRGTPALIQEMVDRYRKGIHS